MSTDATSKAVPTWAREDRSERNGEQQATALHNYREIDRQLRRIAKNKAALDAEEARWLRKAERQRIWRKLGFSTALEYLEAVFGYAPRTAMERLRVAKELGELPQLEAEVQSGALPWSAAKELSRVMTPTTEAAWLARARGKNVHDIGRLVSGHKKGDSPESPKDPNLMTRRLVIEIGPALDALLEQTRLKLSTERGEHLDDVALIEALCMRALELAPPSNGKAPRPFHRIVSHKCDDCSRAWRDGRGRRVEIPPAELAVAACDAELTTAVSRDELTSLFAMTEPNETPTVTKTNRRRPRVATTEPIEAPPPVTDTKPRRAEPNEAPTKQRHRRARPVQSIPQAIREFVWARDQGGCRVPGCRATRNLACHHIEFMSRGGDHDPANIILICDGHHKLLHEGLLVITGRAPDELTFKRDGGLMIDGRSSTEIDAGQQLREQARSHANGGAREAHTIARHLRNEPSKRPTFDDVVTLEHAKQALMQLNFKARAARAAVEAACAHVGTDADVATIVKAALQLTRDSVAADAPSAADLRADAKHALRQLGYPGVIAETAVDKACAHVGADVDLPVLIKEALRWCGR